MARPKPPTMTPDPAVVPTMDPVVANAVPGSGSATVPDGVGTGTDDDGWTIADQGDQPIATDPRPASNGDGELEQSEEREALVRLALDEGITNASDLTLEQLNAALGGPTDDEPLSPFDVADPGPHDAPAVGEPREQQGPTLAPGETATLETAAAGGRRARAPRIAPPERRGGTDPWPEQYAGLPQTVRDRLMGIGISRPMLQDAESFFARMTPGEQANAIAAMSLQTDDEIRHELREREDQLMDEWKAAHPGPHAVRRSRQRQRLIEAAQLAADEVERRQAERAQTSKRSKG